MSTRQWTREALDAAHPEVKAAGWEWIIEDGRPVAVEKLLDGRFHPARIDIRTWPSEDNEHEHLHCEKRPPPPSVALAVILASRGMDSLGGMADAMTTEATTHRTMAGMALDARKPTVAQCAELMVEVYDKAAAMLRRGTVDP
jgi:hypothetical protein